MTAHHSRRLLFGLLCLTTTSPSPPRPHLLLTTTSSPLLAQLRLFFSRSTSSSSSSWSHRRPYLQQQQQQQLVVVSAASFLLRPTFYHPLVRNRNNNRIPLVWGITSRIPSTIHNNNNNIVVNLTTRRKTTSLLTTTSLNAMKPKKFYAVAIGRTTGIFDTWNDCQAQVSLRGILFVYVCCYCVGTATCPPYGSRVVFTLLVWFGWWWLSGCLVVESFCVCVCVFLCCVGRHLYVQLTVLFFLLLLLPPRPRLG